MSLGKRLLSQFKVKFICQIGSVAANAITSVLLARLLAPDKYGLLFLALSVFGILEVLTRLGIGKSAGRYISNYKEKDPSQIIHIIRTSLVFIGITILTMVLLLVVGHQWLADLIGEPELAPFLLVGTGYIIGRTLMKYVRNLFQGFERIEFAAGVDVLDPVSRLVFAIGFVLLGFGAVGALWGFVIGLGVTVVIAFALLFVYLYPRGGASQPIEGGLRRRIMEYSIPLTATGTANRIDSQLDTILVGFFLTPVAVSYYVIGKQAVQFIEMPARALGFTISPTFGSQKAEGNFEQVSRIYETALLNSLLLYIPAAAGLILVAEPLVELLFGSAYLGAVPVLQVLGIYAVFLSVTNITNNGLDYLGRARSRAILTGITAALNVGLNVLLIPWIGVVGAAIATVLTHGPYTLAIVYIASQEFAVRTRMILREILMITAVTAVMAGVVFVLLAYIQGWLTLFLVVGVGALVWMVLSLSVGLLDINEVRSAIE